MKGSWKKFCDGMRLVEKNLRTIGIPVGFR